MGRITPASTLAFIVGETISPKLSLSKNTHMATAVEVPGASSTQAALPPRVPALTTVAPGNFWVKLAIELAGAALARWPPASMRNSTVLPAAEFPDSQTAATTPLGLPELTVI